MSGLRDPVAERRKLAHTLGVEVEQLAMLDSIPADDVRTLRQQVADALFQADRHYFVRLAALAKALPVAAAAKLAEAVFPPLLAARTAELLEPARAGEMVIRLSDSYAADVAAVLDAARAADVVAAIPPDKAGRVARELARRREWVVMGGFVAHVDNAAMSAAVGELDGAELLQISFVLDDLSRTDRITQLLTDRQLDEMLAAAAQHGLWRELGDVIDNLAPERIARFARRFTELDPQVRAQFDVAVSTGRFEARVMAALQSR